jgi:hypothetical protein
MARYFDGVDDIITSANTTGITSYNWIVACWFRTSVASGKKIVGAEVIGQGYFHPHLYVGTDGRLYWGAYDGWFQNSYNTIYRHRQCLAYGGWCVLVEQFSSSVG